MFTPGGDLIYGIDPSKQGHWHLHLCAALQELLRLPEPPHFLVPGYTATIDRWIDPQTQQLRTSAEIYQPVRHHQALLNAVFGTGNLIWQVAPWHEGSCDPVVIETYRHQFPQLWEDHDLIVRFERTERLSYPYSYSFGERFENMEHHPIGSAKDQGNEESSFNKDAIASQYAAQPSDAVETNANVAASEKRSPLPVQHYTSHHFVNAEENEAAPPERPPELHPAPAIASYDDPTEIDTHFEPQRAESYVLRLFVSGHSAATEYTLKSLHQLLEHSLPYPYTLKVIDVFKHPDQAEANHVSATPTLLRVWPQPVRRLVGDLTDIERVLRILAAPED